MFCKWRAGIADNRRHLYNSFLKRILKPTAKLMLGFSACATLSIFAALTVAVPTCFSSPTIEGAEAKGKLAWLNAQIQQNPTDPNAYLARAKFWYNFDAPTRARADLERSIQL